MESIVTRYCTRGHTYMYKQRRPSVANYRFSSNTSAWPHPGGVIAKNNRCFDVIKCVDK